MYGLNNADEYDSHCYMKAIKIKHKGDINILINSYQLADRQHPSYRHFWLIY